MNLLRNLDLDTDTIYDHIYFSKAPFYVFDCYSGYIDGTGDKRVNERHCFEEEEIQTGDMICLEFNVDGDNSYIKWVKNKVDKGVAINANEIKMNDNVKYRLAVSVFSSNDSQFIITSFIVDLLICCAVY